MFYNLFGGWETFHRYKVPGFGFRIGGLADFGSIGLIIVLAGYKKIKYKVFVFLAIFFVFSIFLSGGRTAFISIFIVLMLWAFVEKKYSVVVLLLIVFSISITSIVIFFEHMPGTIKRIVNIIGNFENLDLGRSLIFPIFIKAFMENIWAGVGIGSISMTWEDLSNTQKTWETFIAINLKSGGHGTYLSVLYLLGLIGFIPFILSLIIGILSAYKLYKSKNVDNVIKTLAFGCFLYLINAIIPMSFGGNGSEPQYFLALGVLAGTVTTYSLSKEKYRHSIDIIKR